jgi:threonine dehydrogenase-like Zn-dependent dehydrogenase
MELAPRTSGIRPPLKARPESRNSGGRGVDVAIEAVGIEASLKDCLASAR